MCPLKRVLLAVGWFLSVFQKMGPILPGAWFPYRCPVPSKGADSYFRVVPSHPLPSVLSFFRLQWLDFHFAHQKKISFPDSFYP